MAGYLTRRVLQSLGFIVLVWFAIYTLLVMVMPDGPAHGETTDASATPSPGVATRLYT